MFSVPASKTLSNSKKRDRDSSPTRSNNANKEAKTTAPRSQLPFRSQLQVLQRQPSIVTRKEIKIREKIFAAYIKTAQIFLEQGATDFAKFDYAAAIFYDLLKQKPDNQEARAGLIRAVNNICKKKSIIVLGYYVLAKFDTEDIDSSVKLQDARDQFQKGFFDEAIESFYHLRKQPNTAQEAYLGLMTSAINIYKKEKIKVLLHFVLDDAKEFLAKNDAPAVRLMALTIKHLAKKYNGFAEDIENLYANQKLRERLVHFLNGEYQRFPEELRPTIYSLLKKFAFETPLPMIEKVVPLCLTFSLGKNPRVSASASTVSMVTSPQLTR